MQRYNEGDITNDRKDVGNIMDELVGFQTYFRDELAQSDDVDGILERYGWNKECRCPYCGRTFDVREMIFDAENNVAVCCEACYEKYDSVPPKKCYTVKVVEEYTLDVWAWTASEAERLAQEEAFTQVPDYTGTEIIDYKSTE